MADKDGEKAGRKEGSEETIIEGLLESGTTLNTKVKHSLCHYDHLVHDITKIGVMIYFSR